MLNGSQRPLKRSFAEFFAGIGLMRIGLEKQGWSVAFANDIDPAKFEMYEANFPDAREHFVISDIHSLSATQMPTVALATASFPCNDLSLAGARDGLSGRQSSAFWGFILTLDKMAGRKPPLVLIENVPGFLTSHGGKDFADAMLALNKLGYAVDPFMLDAASFVPQSRQRLFVAGVLGDAGSVQPMEDKFFQSAVRPAALADFIFAHSEISWKLRPLPAPPNCAPLLEDVLEDLPPDAQEWWSVERAAYLINQMSPRHREVANRMMAGNRWSHGTVFRRVRHGKSMAELRTDGLAGCLRTPRGGSGRQILFKAGRGKYFARLMTPRECARLMGADNYRITVPPNQALFGFGDAVCVPVVEWIARNYLNPLFQNLRSHSAPADCPLPDEKAGPGRAVANFNLRFEISNSDERTTRAGAGGNRRTLNNRNQ
jgi:DNA (cytosine-5)-methyltransferase 1